MKLDPFSRKNSIDKNEIRDEFEGKGAKIAEKRWEEAFIVRERDEPDSVPLFAEK